jgi:hypothetical protein
MPVYFLPYCRFCPKSACRFNLISLKLTGLLLLLIGTKLAVPLPSVKKRALFIQPNQKNIELWQQKS